MLKCVGAKQNSDRISKCQLRKIPIEINSKMTGDLEHHIPKYDKLLPNPK